MATGLSPIVPVEDSGSPPFGAPETGGGSTPSAPTPAAPPQGQASFSNPAALNFNDDEMDCSYLGAAIRLRCPGMDSLRVEVSPLSGAITTAVLLIRTGLNGVAPVNAVDITSASGTQTQPNLPLRGAGEAWVEVGTVQAGLRVRVRMNAVKNG